MSKQQIPTLPTSDLNQYQTPSLNSPGSDREMKSVSVKSDIEELEKLFEDKTKGGIAIFKSALKISLENNPNALLHEAAKHGNKDLVVEILKLNPKSINSITPHGLSVLHSAIAGDNSKEIIEILLMVKPTLVTIKDASGLTPSYYTTSKEIIEILQNYERDVIDRIPVETSKYPIAEWSGWENDFEKYMGCKILVGQTDPNINSDKF